MYTPQVVVAAAAWYDALGDNRALVEKTVAETIAWERREAETLDKTTLAELAKSLEIVTLTPPEREAFVAVTRPVYETMSRFIGKDQIEKLQRAAEAARKP